MQVRGLLKCGVLPDHGLPEMGRQYCLLQRGVDGFVIDPSARRQQGWQAQRMTPDLDLLIETAIPPSSCLIVGAVRIFTNDVAANDILLNQRYLPERAASLQRYRERLARAWELVLTHRLRQVGVGRRPSLESLQATYTRVERLLSSAEIVEGLDLAGTPPLKTTAMAIIHWLTRHSDGQVADHEIVWHDQHNPSVSIKVTRPMRPMSIPIPLYFSTFPVKIEVGS